MSGSGSVSPCAACKFLRRKCTSECLFSPYFPPDQPQKFANVHKIFGASNITKLLHDLPVHQREDAVNSLAYEADARVKDPVYGCVGAISVLQQQVAHLQAELAIAHGELTRLHHNQLGVPPNPQGALQPVVPASTGGLEGTGAATGMAQPMQPYLSMKTEADTSYISPQGGSGPASSGLPP